MHAVSLSDRYLRSSNRADRDSAPGLTVDPDGRRKGATEVVRPGVKNIAVLWVAREICQMEPVLSQGNLRLNSVVRNRLNSHWFADCGGRAERRRRCGADQKLSPRRGEPKAFKCHASILSLRT